MSTAFPHCSLESKARAGWLNAPPVPGAAPQTLCHYGQSAPADLGLGFPQGARLKAPADQIGWRPRRKHLCNAPRAPAFPSAPCAAVRPKSLRHGNRVSGLSLNVHLPRRMPATGLPLHFFSSARRDGANN